MRWCAVVRRRRTTFFLFAKKWQKYEGYMSDDVRDYMREHVNIAIFGIFFALHLFYW